MKLWEYVKDRSISLVIAVMTYILLIAMLAAFKVHGSLILATSILLIGSYGLRYSYEFYKKKKFYDTVLFHLESLDKKFLITELIKEPDFYDGKILTQVLYEANKSMIENINQLKYNIADFKEYVELWVHEVKIPLASLRLIVHNQKEELDYKVLEQVDKLENYLDQILYYVRSENSEKDYLIKSTSLNKVVNKVALKNKDSFLYQAISLEVEDLDYEVLTDAKWLEFILNQIVNNSLKYAKQDDNSLIKISGYQENGKVYLKVYDNGIGIPVRDVHRVFEKSFTGENGRKGSSSTGMGLYLCKNLCQKLGHKIEISSKEGEYTAVLIIFNQVEQYHGLK